MMELNIIKDKILDIIIREKEFQYSPKMLSRYIGCSALEASTSLKELVDEGFIDYYVTPNGFYCYRVIG